VDLQCAHSICKLVVCTLNICHLLSLYPFKDKEELPHTNLPLHQMRYHAKLVHCKSNEVTAVVKVRGPGGSAPLLPFEPPAIV